MITLADIQRALDDPRHLGYGYAERRYFVDAYAAKLDQLVVDVANELGLDYEDFFAWTNSKYGRWLCDSAGDDDTNPTTDDVRAFLNQESVNVVTERTIAS